MEQTSFSNYLKSKKIDEKQFQMAEPDQFHDWKKLFDTIHPASFTAQKLFFINATRRKYPLIEELSETETTQAVKPKQTKPKIRMKPKIK